LVLARTAKTTLKQKRLVRLTKRGRAESHLLAETSADPESSHSRIANMTPYCFGEDPLAVAAKRPFR
jgi:hypothetical protein